MQFMDSRFKDEKDILVQSNVPARLILEDGSVFNGIGFGCEKTAIVEVVFNTSMVGYQEILSDPSYTNQAVVLTYPLIGNYGINDEDYETEKPSLSGFIVREYNDQPSNFRSKETLDAVMKRFGIVGISGVDTRKITRHIREHGSCMGMITRQSPQQLTVDDAVKFINNCRKDKHVVAGVSTKNRYTCPAEGDSYGEKAGMENFHVAAIDCGMKRNIVRMLCRKGCRVTVVPWDTSAEAILALKPDGVFVSNGPGDPVDVPETVKTIRELRGKVPVFGICLGHQIISLAYGGKTYKLHFGHRGGNHPVRHLLTGKIEMTSQNHSYAVDGDSLKDTDLEVTHINLLDRTVEGVRCEKDHVSAVQYHPESAPGPQDSAYLFDVFLKDMSDFKEGINHA